MENKQETLEEAAEKYGNNIGNKNGTAQFDFIQGAKWQQEIMYEIMNAYVDDVMGGCNLRAKEWFEQFKKK